MQIQEPNQKQIIQLQEDKKEYESELCRLIKGMRFSREEVVKKIMKFIPSPWIQRNYIKACSGGTQEPELYASGYDCRTINPKFLVETNKAGALVTLLATYASRKDLPESVYANVRLHEIIGDFSFQLKRIGDSNLLCLVQEEGKGFFRIPLPLLETPPPDMAKPFFANYNT